MMALLKDFSATRKNSLKNGLFLFAPPLLLIGLWLYAFQPGLFDIDFAFLMKGILSGHLSSWHSFFYSGLHWVSWTLFESIYPVMSIQLGLFAAALLLLHQPRSGFSKKDGWLLFAFLFLTPLHSTQLLNYSRDAFFAAAFSLCLVLAFVLYEDRKPTFHRTKLYSFAILISVLGGLRFENAILVLGFALIVNFLLVIKKTERLVFNSIVIFLSLFLKFAPPYFLNLPLNDPTYLLTSVVHPLSAIAHHGKMTNEDSLAIEKVISVAALREDYSPYEIMPFHNSGPKNFSTQEWNQFCLILPGLFIDNFRVVIESRLTMLVANLGFGGEINLLPNAKFDPKQPITEVFLKLGLKPESPPNWLARAYFKMHEWAEEETVFKFIFYSAGPFLYLSFLILRSRKRNPFACWLLGITWLRLPLLFIFIPGSQIKYFYPMYLGTIFCYFIAKIEGKKNPI